MGFILQATIELWINTNSSPNDLKTDTKNFKKLCKDFKITFKYRDRTWSVVNIAASAEEMNKLNRLEESIKANKYLDSDSLKEILGIRH